jgi:hypothetical protein
MSSQWMPFALWGFNRFVTQFPAPGSRLPLLLGTAALVMQNWSCGYYLLYFAPFVPLFLIHQMWTHGKLKDVRIWASLTAAGVATLLLTLPFLIPYAKAQETFGLERPFGEVVLFSANVWSYITASQNVRLWGEALRFYPHGEGETFLGFVPWLLALIAVASLFRTSSRTPPVASGFSRTVTWVLTVVVVTQLIAVLSVFLFGGFEIGPISARTPQRLVLQLIIAYALLLGISPRARVESLRLLRSPVFFAFALTFLAIWLSLGPIPKAGDSLVSGLGLYRLLYDYVPGFNGVRVPARYAMIAGLFLAIVAGYGYRALAESWKLRAALIVMAAFILAEGAAIPMELNRTWNQNEALPPARVMKYSDAPPVYQRLAELPEGTAVTEFPFGDAAWEIRYVYYAASHWKPITNGYSGNFPPRYKERVARLMRVDKEPEAAWKSLGDAGTTHVVVHRNAFANAADADTVESWLKAHGARELERFADNDILLSIK